MCAFCHTTHVAMPRVRSARLSSMCHGRGRADGARRPSACCASVGAARPRPYLTRAHRSIAFPMRAVDQVPTHVAHSSASGARAARAPCPLAPQSPRLARWRRRARALPIGIPSTSPHTRTHTPPSPLTSHSSHIPLPTSDIVEQASCHLVPSTARFARCRKQARRLLSCASYRAACPAAPLCS